jgi:uncharacterized protein YndB with AHSA1/START domain
MKSELVVRCLIPAAQETVFRVWTQPEHVQKWWGPRGVTCPMAEIDLRVGGTYRIANLLPDGKTVWIHGVFEEIDPPHRLTYTWGFGLEDEPAERVTVTFEPRPEGTEVMVVHENIPDEAARVGHEKGWYGCLDGLEEYAGAGLG